MAYLLFRWDVGNRWYMYRWVDFPLFKILLQHWCLLLQIKLLFSLASSFSLCRYSISSFFYASCCFLSYFFTAISWRFSSFSTTSCNHFYICSCNGVCILETKVTLNSKYRFLFFIILNIRISQCSLSFTI